jgi:signal transduction histidine kinase
VNTSRPPDPSITIGGTEFDWQTDEGTVTFSGIPIIMAWVDSTLAGLMQGVHAMVGTKRFALALQAEGRNSVAHDWEIFRTKDNFRDGFDAVAALAGIAGWGRWELMECDPDNQRCSVRVWNSWEGLYQKKLGVVWGSAMLAGKFAGYFTRQHNINCWAEQTHYIAKGDPYDEFVVGPSELIIEKELERLLDSDDATRADMAVALRQLRKEIASRKELEQQLRMHEDVVRNMRTGLHVYHLEDPSDDHTLRFVDTNPQGESMLGAGADTFRGKLIDDCFPQARNLGLPQLYARLALNGESTDLGDVYYEDGQYNNWYRIRAFGLPGCRVGITFDVVTQAKEAERALVKTQDQLRQLGRHLELSREAERQNAAHLLDEELGQVLAALHLHLKAPLREGESFESRQQVLSEMVDSGIETLRHMSLELRPPELAHLGLTEAIRAECDRTRARRDLDITTTGMLHDDTLDPTLAIALFRMMGTVVHGMANGAEQVQIQLHQKHSTLQIMIDVRLGEHTPLPSAADSLLLTELRERVMGWDGQVSLVPLDLHSVRFMITVASPDPALTPPPSV